ncbi:MAG TPA: carboxypeptidase regulatory-like domain-containing protein [Gemmatimonadales bacterium]|nr:carboxypeptidase regulatory-like domain-containing protein [Gemmatimonadales bacterium]
MRWIVSLSRVVLAAALWSLCCICPASAQGVTTGAVAGIVSDSAGGPLEGARVVAVHGPSGTTYATVTRADGRFTIPGMRVGGPYRVSANRLGYRPEAQNGIEVTLGQTTDLTFKMAQASVQLEAVNVEAPAAGSVFSSERTGAATTVSADQLSNLPTISRKVEDVLRLTPQYSGISQPSSSGAFSFISFAGQDNRLNNMTIDGSYFNNSFGLGGQPGDRTGVAPISLDALEQIQVNIAPYDVRQGNFVGAGINMVTKSGTNQFTGSAFYNTRSNSFVGTQAGPNAFNPGTFQYHDVGFALGGPIVKNKLFFFGSYEDDAATAPGTTFLANTGGQTVGGSVTRVLASDLDALSTFLKTNFNYTTGPYQNYDFKTPSTRFITRVDYNLNDHNKLSFRYNLLNSETPVLISNSASLGLGNRRSNLTSLNFANSNYAILENLRSVVGEWNSSFGNKANNLILGYNTSDESRKNVDRPWFPLVEILNNGTNYTTFGFEPFTPDNKLFYHSYQLQDNFTIYLPKHSVTFGASLEKYHSTNVFFPGAQSVYVFNSLQDFYTAADSFLANPSRTVSPVSIRRFQYRYANIPGLKEPVQPLDVLYGGVYAQDEWRPTPNLTLTAGLRIDAPKFTNTAYDNPVADTMTFRDASGSPVHYNSGALPGVNPLWSPRLGFNYDVGGRHNTQLRGGTGIFTGRPAYVWISNQVGNTGVLTGFIQQDNTTAYPFNPNPDAYKPATVTGAPAASFQLALTDPKFKFPQVWRSNIALDQQLPWGITGTAEYMYTKDVNGIAYINANLPAPQTTFSGPDGRPRWTSNRIYANVSDATTLTNQGIGHSANVAASLERAFRSGLFAKLGWSYGTSKNTVDAGSIASGSWTGNQIAVDPNNPPIANSQFAPGHRFFGAVSYKRDFFGLGATTIAVFLEDRSPGNASYVTSGDMNGDGANGNDLIYVPRNQGEMNFVTNRVIVGVDTVFYTPAQQAAAWDAFINQDPYLSKRRGQYAERNGAFLPMVFRADLSIAQDVTRKVSGNANSLQIRLDIFNFLNMLNSDWGVSQGFVTLRPLTYAGVDASGAPTYRLANVGINLISQSFQKNVSTLDVWRMQLGVRYMFNW